MKSWSMNGLFLVLALISLIAANVIAYHLPLRIDATEDRLFTISEGSRTILKDLQDPVRVKFYFTFHNEELPPSFKAYAQRVQELLEEYEQLAEGRLIVEVYDPKPDSEEEEWANRYGIEAATLPSGTNVFFGAVFLQLDQEIVLPFFDPRRQEFLEYDLSQSIYRVTQTERPKIGLWTNLAVQGIPQLRMQGQGGEPWVIVEELEKTFDIQTLDPSLTDLSDDLDLVLLLHPKDLSIPQLYALDQYVLRGGSLFIALDSNARAEAMQAGGPPPANFASDLPMLLQAWGVVYDPTQVVGDLRLATPVNSREGVIRFPPWISLGPNQLDRDHPITSQLEQLLFAEAGSLSEADNASFTFTPLIQTSSDSGSIEAFQLRFGSPEQIARDLKSDGTRKTLLAQVQGAFRSAFPDGPPEGVTSPAGGHLKEAAESRTILIASDVDWLTDGFSVQRLNFLGQRVIQPSNDNLNLALNAVEYLSGHDGLQEIRSRGQFQRPFTRVLALQQAAQLRYQEQENQLQASLQAVQSELNQLLQGAGQSEKDLLLPKEVQDQVAEFRKEERQTRRELREVRNILRQDIERLGNRLLLLNLLVVPSLVGIFGWISYRRRSKNR